MNAFLKFLQFPKILTAVVCMCLACAKPSNRPLLDFTYSPTASGSLTYTFTVAWQRLSNQNNLYDELWLKFSPGPPPFPHQDWYVRTFSSSDTDYENGTETKTYTFAASGTHAALVELRSSGGVVKEVSNIKYIQVVGNSSTQRQFKFRVLSMGNNNAFLSYGSYGGFGKAQTAFAQAETQLVESAQAVSGIQPQAFESQADLFSWTVTHAGGNESLPGFGLNQDIAIACAIEDVTTGVIASTTALGWAPGRGQVDGKPVPARTYTFVKRIRDKGYDSEKTAVLTTGTTINELGHARGIIHTPDAYNTVQPHGGVGLSYCIMWPATLPPSNTFVEQRAYLYEPYFCEWQRNFLKTITW